MTFAFPTDNESKPLVGHSITIHDNEDGETVELGPFTIVEYAYDSNEGAFVVLVSDDDGNLSTWMVTDENPITLH